MNIECARKQKQKKPSNTETKKTRRKHFHFSYKENKESTHCYFRRYKTCQVKKNKLRENYFNINSCVQRKKQRSSVFRER